MVKQPIVISDLVPELKEKFYVLEKYKKNGAFRPSLEQYQRDAQPVRLYLMNSMVIEGEIDKVTADSVILYGHNDDFITINMSAVVMVEVFNPAVNEAVINLQREMQQMPDVPAQMDEVADVGFSVVEPKEE
jgi:hypothetical protein